MRAAPRAAIYRALLDPSAIAVLPEQTARRHNCIPVRFEDGRLVIAMADPANVVAVDDIRAILDEANEQGVLDGDAFRPCQTPVADCDGREVTTIEGLADGEDLHPVQEAWLEQDVAQCGFCQPGQIMAAVALLKRNPNPTDAEIDEIENVCRCGTYFRIREAIKSAAAAMR